MNEITQTLKGTINRLNEDNDHLGTQYHLENEKIHVLEKVLKEYKENQNNIAMQVQHNDREIRKLKQLMEGFEIVQCL